MMAANAAAIAKSHQAICVRYAKSCSHLFMVHQAPEEKKKLMMRAGVADEPTIEYFTNAN
jgi:hypothetical protein